MVVCNDCFIFYKGTGLFGKLTCFFCLFFFFWGGGGGGGGESEFEIVFGELLHASTHSTGTVIDLL